MRRTLGVRSTAPVHCRRVGVVHDEDIERELPEASTTDIKQRTRYSPAL